MRMSGRAFQISWPASENPGDSKTSGAGKNRKPGVHVANLALKLIIYSDWRGLTSCPPASLFENMPEFTLCGFPLGGKTIPPPADAWSEWENYRLLHSFSRAVRRSKEKFLFAQKSAQQPLHRLNQQCPPPKWVADPTREMVSPKT